MPKNVSFNLDNEDFPPLPTPDQAPPSISTPTDSFKKRRASTGDGSESEQPSKAPKLSSGDRPKSSRTKAKSKESKDKGKEKAGEEEEEVEMADVREMVSELTGLKVYCGLNVVKFKDFMMMGGKPPKDLIISKERLRALAENPYGFVLAMALDPQYEFKSEVVHKVEMAGGFNEDLEIERKKKGGMVYWYCSEARDPPLWTANKPVEGLTLEKAPYMMGGHSSLWPFPLQRQGWYANKVWKVVFPGAPSVEGMEILAGLLNQHIGSVSFWTLSKRCVYTQTLMVL
jgi:hypothetical protein